MAGATTNVSGTIATDTTWSWAYSPYVVTDNVTVNSGVTLTVEPGVIVKFNETKGHDGQGAYCGQRHLDRSHRLHLDRR